MAKCTTTTLDVRGQLTDPYQVLDQLLADVFVANYSQSVLYKGHVSSMVYLLKKHADDPSALASATENMLTAYLSRHFDLVHTAATVVDYLNDPDVIDKRFTLRLEIKFTVNNVAYDAAHLAFIENSKFKRIINEAKGEI